MVVRGLCWEWDDQDGGEGQVGKITEIQEFHSKYRRNVARVQWLGNAVSNVYRIGHNGKVFIFIISYQIPKATGSNNKLSTASIKCEK